MKKKKLGKKAKAIRPALVITFIIIGFTLAFNVPHPVLKQDDEKSWHIIFEGNLLSAAEANPGVGASGILEIFFVNHSVGNDYKTINTSATLETWCNANLAAGGGNAWANADDFNLELKHSVLFDIAIKIRVNMSDSGNGTDFNENWVRMFLNSSDMSVSTAAMEKNVLVNDSGKNFMWVMFYYDFGNSGYDLSKDEIADIDNIKLEAYY